MHHPVRLEFRAVTLDEPCPSNGVAASPHLECVERPDSDLPKHLVDPVEFGSMMRRPDLNLRRVLSSVDTNNDR